MALPDIDGLRIDGVLGEGGFATVYKAWDAEFDRFVAVKVLDSPFADEDAKRHFVRECRSLGRLSDHPGIITVHRTAETATGRAALIMAFADEGTWQDRIDRGGLLDETGMLDAGRQLSDALAAAHTRNVLHLDIKPANVLVTYGHPMLADFGISRLMDSTMTMTAGAQKLTIQYAAPEMFEGARPKPATDVWSLAATLCAMVAGVPPFGSGESGLLAVMAAVTGQDPMDLREHGLSPAVWSALRSCFEKDPANRPPDGGALRALLADATGQRSATAHVPADVLQQDPLETNYIPFTPPSASTPSPSTSPPPTTGQGASGAFAAPPDATPTGGGASGFGDVLDGVFGQQEAPRDDASTSPASDQLIGVVRTPTGTELAWRRGQGHRVATLGVHWDRGELDALLREMSREIGGAPQEAIVGVSRTTEIEAVNDILGALGVTCRRAVPHTTLLADTVMDREISPDGDIVVAVVDEGGVEAALVTKEHGVLEVRSRGWLPAGADLAAQLPRVLARPSHETSLVLAGRSVRVSDAPRGSWRHVKVLTDQLLATAACGYGRILTGERTDAVVLDALVGDIAIETAGGPHVLVPADTTIPNRKAEVLTTHEDGQVAIEAHLLGGVPAVRRAHLDLRDLPPAPAGVPDIELAIEVQAGAVVVATMTHVQSGRRSTARWGPLTRPLR